MKHGELAQDFHLKPDQVQKEEIPSINARIQQVKKIKGDHSLNLRPCIPLLENCRFYKVEIFNK